MWIVNTVRTNMHVEWDWRTSKRSGENWKNVSLSIWLELMFSISDHSSCLLSLSFQSNSKSLCWYEWEEADIVKAFTSQLWFSLRFFLWLSSHWAASMVDHDIPEISRASFRLLAYHRIGRGTSTNIRRRYVENSQKIKSPIPMQSYIYLISKSHNAIKKG